MADLDDPRVRELARQVMAETDHKKLLELAERLVALLNEDTETKPKRNASAKS